MFTSRSPGCRPPSQKRQKTPIITSRKTRLKKRKTKAETRNGRDGAGLRQLRRLGLLLLLHLEQQRAVDVGQHAAVGDGGLDEGVELLVAADGELEVAGGDALYFEVLGGVLRGGSATSVLWVCLADGRAGG